MAAPQLAYLLHNSHAQVPVRTPAAAEQLHDDLAAYGKTHEAIPLPTRTHAG